MTRFISLFVFLSFSFLLSAQEIEVKKFEQIENGKTVVDIKNDNNGNPCALLIVQSLKEGLEFEGWVVGDSERKDDTYWVFVANGAKHIKIKHTDYQTRDVVFGEYGINSLTGGQTYILQLLDDTKDIVNKVYSFGWNLGKMEIPSNAMSFLRMAAKRGDTKALTAMAQLSLEGDVRGIDGRIENRGLEWVKKLLIAGDSTCLDQMPGELMYAYAQYLHYDSYHRAGIISTDRSINRIDTIRERLAYDIICEYEIKACKKGFAQAGEALFEDYLKSNGLPQYSKDIIRCCEDSAQIGNISAMKCLGMIFEKGICEDVDLKIAEKWYKLMSAHDANDLCRVYGNKRYPISDKEMRFLQEQADKGLNEALFQLGCMYEEGRNVQINIDKAVEFFNKCNLDGYHLSHEGAAIHLAQINYKKGNFDKAAELLIHGINYPNMDATYLRGVMMYEGKGTNWTIRGGKAEAISLLTSIAKQGHAQAIKYLKNIGH